MAYVSFRFAPSSLAKTGRALYLKAVPCQPPVNASTHPLYMQHNTRCAKRSIQRYRKAKALWKNLEFNVGDASDLYIQQKQVQVWAKSMH